MTTFEAQQQARGALESVFLTPLIPSLRSQRFKGFKVLGLGAVARGFRSRV